jgi:hypothetical protein
MHWIFEKATLKEPCYKFYKVFFVFFYQELSLGTKHHLLRLREKTNKFNPSTSSKCSSLTTNLMILKFGENLQHFLNKNWFKFGTNSTVDLIGTTIWNKNPEALSWKSFHELHYKHPLLLANVLPHNKSDDAEIWGELSTLLNKSWFKFGTNPTVDLGGTINWNKNPKALSWISFHELHYKHPLFLAIVAPSQ